MLSGLGHHIGIFITLFLVRRAELVLQSADNPHHLLGKAFHLKTAELPGHRDPVLEHLEQGAELGAETESHVLAVLAFETVAAHLHIFNNPATEVRIFTFQHDGSFDEAEPWVES